MNYRLTLITLAATTGLSLGQAFGPNTPAIGTIVPEEISFTISTQSQDELLTTQSLEPASSRRLVDYTEFSGQVLVVVYHASW